MNEQTILSLGDLALRLHSNTEPCSVPTMNFVGMVGSSLGLGTNSKFSVGSPSLRMSHHKTWPSVLVEKHSVPDIMKKTVYFLLMDNNIREENRQRRAADETILHLFLTAKRFLCTPDLCDFALLGSSQQDGNLFLYPKNLQYDKFMTTGNILYKFIVNTSVIFHLRTYQFDRYNSQLPRYGDL